MVWGAMTASDVSKLHMLPPNQIVRAKYIQESFLSLFLPDDMNKTGETGKVTERRFMKHVGLDIVAEQSTSLQGHRNSKSDLKQFFSVLNQRLMTPKHA